MIIDGCSCSLVVLLRCLSGLLHSFWCRGCDTPVVHVCVHRCFWHSVSGSAPLPTLSLLTDWGYRYLSAIACGVLSTLLTPPKSLWSRNTMSHLCRSKIFFLHPASWWRRLWLCAWAFSSTSAGHLGCCVHAPTHVSVSSTISPSARASKSEEDMPEACLSRIGKQVGNPGAVTPIAPLPRH